MASSWPLNHYFSLLILNSVFSVCCFTKGSGACNCLKEGVLLITFVSLSILLVEAEIPFMPLVLIYKFLLLLHVSPLVFSSYLYLSIGLRWPFSLKHVLLFFLKNICQSLHDVSSALHKSLWSSALADLSTGFLEHFLFWYKTRIISVYPDFLTKCSIHPWFWNFQCSRYSKQKTQDDCCVEPFCMFVFTFACLAASLH